MQDQNSTIRAPSPRKHASLFQITDPAEEGASTETPTPSTAPTPTPTTVLSSHPHLGHYIFSLLNNAHFPPPRSTLGQHPLSVSSSGESDGEESDEDQDQGNVSQSGSEAASATSTASNATKASQDEGSGKRLTLVEKEELVRKIVDLLDNEQEEEVKVTLRPYMGELGKDEALMDQVCLECMHKRKGDAESLPYVPHLTPTRARASPSLGSFPGRPFTPTRVPSFRSRTPLSRTHSPVPPIPAHSATGSAKGHSPVPSPIGSPRLLNAKAITFAPSPRLNSVSSGMNPTVQGFIPSDAWKDVEPPRSNSPFGAIGASMSRTGSSNLAMATPLFSDQSSPFHSPIGTPYRAPIKMPDVFTSSPAKHERKGIFPEGKEDVDEFSSFAKGLLQSNHEREVNPEAKVFSFFPPSSYGGGNGTLNPNVGEYIPSTSSSVLSFDPSSLTEAEAEEEGAGMTPLDVLCSIFTSVPRSELEDALHRSGYDFEAAMTMLVAQYTQSRSETSPPGRASPRPTVGMGRGGRDGYFPTTTSRTLRSSSPGPLGSSVGKSPGGHAGKMCRYFLAGECRRSDCRFSHDLDRAMCRFWLRGHCAKGPNCEFLHQFPNNLDVSALQNAMARVELSQDDYNRTHSPGIWQQQREQEEFPDLASAGRVNRPRFDPSRNRFANAIKRAAPALPRDFPTTTTSVPSDHQSESPTSISSAPAVPRLSKRIKLRPPTLLPTLVTGSSVNEQYLSSRSTSIRLGHARNACLARAADAFRRGDGAAAKRFSREGKALNMRMINESTEAAHSLIQTRQAAAQAAVLERPTTWSDDPHDRSERGKACAGGLGVVLGVASAKRIAGAEHLESGERTEVLLDLHTLHGNEGVEICGQFLAELERERFRGLAYVVIGEEKHVGTQDPLRGASKTRLGTSIKNALAQWGYAWNENGGVVCVDVCRNM
ncbi:hypothetical protein L204_105357 [Cryptococcus depauperatus]